MSLLRLHATWHWTLLAGILVFGCATGTKPATDPKPTPESSVKDPTNDPASQYKLGNTLFDDGKYTEAQAAYENVLRINPKHQSAHANLALTLKRQGLMEQALKEYLTALELDPKDDVTRENYVIALEESGHSEEAVKELEAVTGQDPKNANNFRHLGAILRDLNRNKEAGKAFEKVLALEPDNADDYYDLGLCYFCDEDWDRTLTTWLTAIAHNPKHVAANKGIAVAYWKRGDYDKAWEAVSHCGELGILVDAKFLAELEKSSGRKSR